MMQTNYKGKERVIIEPGEIFTSRDDVIISTTLGSCISVCLWDATNRVIGMNHFVLVGDSANARYGRHAMNGLIDSMLAKGAQKQYLRAKAFGGANVVNSGAKRVNVLNVGEDNSQFMKRYLVLAGIPLVASSIGGDFGRVIHFFYSDFSVYMKRLSSMEPTL